MNTLRTASSLFVVVSLATLGAACVFSSSNDECLDAHCKAHPTGPTYGVDGEGRVAITASQAWPNRPTEPTVIAAEDVARACAALGACYSSWAPPSSSTDDESIAAFTALCTAPDSTEERAVPMSSSNERWSWWLRAVLANPTCDAIAKLKTDRAKGTYCEEDGCWWTDAQPVVSCSGTVATISANDGVHLRDCARSYTTCDVHSATGCADRAPVACDAKGIDRCDGDVKLGCDHNGLVSFHDCSLIHATCVQSATGASCVPKDDAGCELGAQACDGSKLSLCAFGAKVTVDCAELGFAGCNRGHCVAK